MSTMRSQSGTFYKIIVTLFILGVNHLSLSTSSPSRGASVSGCNEGRSSPQLPLVPSAPSDHEPLTSASTLNAAMASVVFLKDGATNGTEESSGGSGPTGSLNSIATTKSEGTKLSSAVAPQEAKETLQTAAQSYFIEPEQSTTTTQRPTFTRRKTQRPISSLTEKKKANEDRPVENEIPQGGPVPVLNPFRPNSSFGKSRPSNGKFGRARARTTVSPQTGSDSEAETKPNEIPSSKTEGDARPSFNRRRPAPRPSFTPSNNGTDATPEAPKARRFPLRKPIPFNEGNKNSENHGAGGPPPRPRAFRRQRPGNSSLTGSKPEIGFRGKQEDGFPKMRRVRPIRPLVHSRLTNADKTTTTTIAATTTTAVPEPKHEESPVEDILGLSKLHLNENRPTTTSDYGFSPIPLKSMPEHLNNIINGIGPIPVPPSSGHGGEIDASITPLRPSLRAGADNGGRQGFVLRPRSSTHSPLDGENEIHSRQQNRRRKRPTTTETPDDSNKGDVPRPRIRGNERNPQSSRGRIPESGVPRNQHNPPLVRSRVVIPDILEHEEVPVRGGRINNGLQRTPSSTSAFSGGIVIQDLRGNEEVSARGSRFNSGLQRNPGSSTPPRGSVHFGNQGIPLGGGNSDYGYPRNPDNSSPLHGGVISHDHSDNYDSPPPLRRIPSIVQDKQRSPQTNLPYPNIPSFANIGFPQSYQIRDEPMIPSILPIPQFKQMPDHGPIPDSPRQNGPSGLPGSSIPSSPPAPHRRPAPGSSGLPVSSIPSSPSGPELPVSRPPSRLTGSNIPSSPTVLPVPIPQSLNAALSPNSFQSSPPVGLFQVPPADNLQYYPGLDNILTSPNAKSLRQKSSNHRFSSRTTLVPEEIEISFNDRSPSASASNDNQAIILSDISYPSPPLSVNNGEATAETSQPDTATTTTTTAAAPTRRLSPIEKLQKNRQSAARKLLTPRKPTEKTTLAPSAVNKKPLSLLRKSVIPPRTLRTRGKSLPQETDTVEANDNTPKKENPGGNESTSDINNESASLSSSEPDTVNNVVPISADKGEVEPETSSRKPTLLEKARRRRLPVASKSAVSPVQQFQQHHMQKSRNVSNLPTPQHQDNVDAPPPACEEGQRYNKFLKRCVASYKPRVQG